MWVLRHCFETEGRSIFSRDVRPAVVPPKPDSSLERGGSGSPGWSRSEVWSRRSIWLRTGIRAEASMFLWILCWRRISNCRSRSRFLIPGVFYGVEAGAGTHIPSSQGLSRTSPIFSRPLAPGARPRLVFKRPSHRQLSLHETDKPDGNPLAREIEIGARLKCKELDEIQRQHRLHHIKNHTDPSVLKH